MILLRVPFYGRNSSSNEIMIVSLKLPSQQVDALFHGMNCK